MFRIRALSAVVATAAFALLALSGAVVANAVPTQHYFVRTDGSDAVCDGRADAAATHAPHCAFQTIDHAVAVAAAGDTITVAAGTYAEEVSITKNLTIRGAGEGSTIITVPAVPASNVPSPYGANTGFALVAVNGAGLELSDVTLTGPFTLPDGCADQFYGAFAYNSGALNLHDATVANIVNSNPLLYGCQQGVGIEVGRAALGTSGSADIRNVTVYGYQKGGIVFSNDGTTGSVSDSTVTGPGPNTTLSKAIAPNGIEVAFGALARVTGNTITGNVCDDAAGGCNSDPINGVQSVGILEYDAANGVQIDQNVTTGNDEGIYVQSRGTTELGNNRAENNRYVQIYLDQGTAQLNNNRMVGGNIGLAAVSFAGATADTVGFVNSGEIVHAAQQDVLIDNQNAPGPPVVRLVIEDSTKCDGQQCKPYDTDDPGHGPTNQPHP